ncbi:hypothetical protein CPAV1605_1103 [seawater metagenome]|uniref:YubB ferredoxin-like domain-containing protein n=1 Tax=seawater metagenome TaxID=1561972 RepID=A0A5E8CM41_9ZZZZ
MPNWCNCTLILKAESNDDLTYFFEENKDENKLNLNFNRKVPTDNTNSLVDNQNIWGTGLNIDNQEFSITIKNKLLIYKFLTPYTPPILWVQKVSQIFDKIIFEIMYAEHGSNTGGNIKFISGKALSFRELNYSNYVWNYELDKKFILDKTIQYYDKNISQILINLRLPFYHNMLYLNRACEGFLPWELKHIIRKYIMLNLIKKEVKNFLKTRVNKQLLEKYLQNNWDLTCQELLDTNVLPLLHNKIIKVLQQKTSLTF